MRGEALPELERDADASDTLRFYRLCKRCLGHVEAHGACELSREPVYYLA